MASAPPTIFSKSRRVARRKRMLASPDKVHFLLDDMAEDMAERLSFLRHEPKRALVIGDYNYALGNLLERGGAAVTRADISGLLDNFELELEHPYPFGEFDFIAVLGLLDTVNDLPGALLHIRKALAPGGLAIASFLGAGSLPQLRRIMLNADGERPAGRMHPLVDVRAAAQLLQRAEWADPVVDSRTITAAYRSFDRLVGDVRAQGLGNVLARPAQSGGKVWLERARQAFAELADEQGRVVESFEILTLSGRRA